MTCEKTIQEYCREVERGLELPRTRRQALLGGLRQELEEKFSPAKELTGEALSREAGTPRETAAFLMESVSEAEKGRYRTQKRRRSRALIAALAAVAVLAVCLVIHMWSNGGLAVIETTHYADGIPENFPMGGEGKVTYQYDD